MAKFVPHFLQVNNPIRLQFTFRLLKLLSLKTPQTQSCLCSRFPATHSTHFKTPRSLCFLWIPFFRQLQTTSVSDKAITCVYFLLVF